MTTTFIYSLSDPITKEIRYIGKTNNPKERLKNHCNPARYKPTHIFNWIKKLRELGLKPTLDIVEEVGTDIWKDREKYWIKFYLNHGCKLVNQTDGGDGLSFGNQTSFKKGQKSWNSGTAPIKICIVCNVEFKPPNSKQQTCSYVCANHIKTGHEGTQFKKGSIPWNKGVENYKLKGLKTSKLVEQYTLDGVFIQEHVGCKEAGLKVGCGQTNIRNVCLGHSKTAKNFKWKYKNEQ